ncbi:MAG TPA: DMT family transporter [Telluria sp.]|jgi:drug/metabolite transporter (DMT)-like permease|nr:DMT family transporter [Telluria sp.]
MSGRGNLRSIYAMLIAVAVFSLMDTALKLLTVRYPPMQVAALRALTSLPLMLVYVGWRGAYGGFFRVRWSLQLLRGVLGIAMLSLFAYGLRAVSLAEAYSIFFIAPALITALSVVILKERVDCARWIAILVGLVGVVVVLRPTGQGMLTLGGLAILCAAGCYAVSAIMARILGRTDRNEHVMLWLILLMSAGASVLAAPTWVGVRIDDAPLLCGLAVSGFVGQLAITEAFSRGEPSSVAPLEYTALAWGVGLDWLLWRTLPDQFTLIGAAIIIGSGIYLIRHEHGHAASEHP